MPKWMPRQKEEKRENKNLIKTVPSFTTLEEIYPSQIILNMNCVNSCISYSLLWVKLSFSLIFSNPVRPWDRLGDVINNTFGRRPSLRFQEFIFGFNY